MNKKASKNSLQLPLGLNLADNNLHIDSEFSTFEHCNAPYINNMYMPLYKTFAEAEGPTAFDANGVKYTVKDGALYKNDTRLFNVTNKKFKKTKLDLSEYLSWDADAWIKFRDTNNTIECSNGFTSEPLFDNGSIIAARVRNINNHTYAFIYYINDLGEQKALILVDNIKYESNVVWYKQLPRKASNAAYTPTAVSGVYSSPLIQITVLDNAPVFTMVSKYGTVMASDDVYFTNFVIYNGLVYITNNLRPASQTFSGEVTETVIGTFTITNTQVQSTGNAVAYRKLIDGQYVYYKNENGAYIEITPPATQIWTETGNTVTIDGETFDEVTTQTKEYGFTTQVQNTSNNVSTFEIRVNDSEGANSVQTTTGTAIVTRLVTKYSSEPEYTYSISSIEMIWNNVESSIPSAYWNGAVYSDSRTTTTEQTNLTYSVAPNIFLDDGTMYSLYGFDVTTSNWNANAIAAGLTIVDSARFNSWALVDGNLTYAFTATEFTSVDTNARAIISNSFTVGQNFFSNTTKMGGNGNPPSTASSAGVTDGNKFLEWTNSNCNDKKYWPGTTPYTDKNYNGLTGWEDGQMVFTIQGYRSSLGNKWNLLYNTRESGNSMLNGISYSNTIDEAGTLLTEWQSVDPSFYVSSTDDYFVYRDNNKQYWKVEIVDDAVDIIAILSNRLILINTTSYYNAYDTVLGLPLHAFTDFNNRVLYGSDTPTIKSGAADVVRTAEAINNLYSIEPRNLMSSNNEGVVSRYRVEIVQPTVYRYVCPESAFIQPIDIFYQSTTAVAANYQFSIIPERVQTRTITTSLIGTVYQVRVGQLSPSLWVKIVDGTGNTDVAIEGRNAYPLVYDVDTPVFLYDVSSTLTNVDAMFILQGQYYAVINNKIYSLIYSNGAIAEMDAIVEIRGFRYVGSTTSIAFFYSERMRAFYSFTGDANLQHIFDASKIADIYTFLNGSSYIYDESTQSIYIPTNVGLLVFGPKNTYLLEDIIRPSMIYFTDDTLWHIVSDDSITTFSYYYREGFTSNKVILETEFFGIGDTESTSIDKWNIKLFTQTGDADNVKLSVRSITDITTKSEDKVLSIAVNAWDKWSKAVLISYAPALIKGAGIRIRIETDNAVESITPHIMDNNTGTLTRRQA